MSHFRFGRRFFCALLAAPLFGLTVGSAAASEGTFVTFPVAYCANVVNGLTAITAGPDGNLWFTDPVGGVGRIDTDGGSSTCFGVPMNPTGIVTGPDGNLWFVDNSTDQVGRITPTGQTSFFSIGGSYINLISSPSDIVVGPDGNLWFTELGDDLVGRVTTSGAINTFAVPTVAALPTGIAAGSDGNLWFTEQNASKIGRITPTGTITEFSIPTANSGPTAITGGPDGDVWFAESNASQIGRITPSGHIKEFPIPTGGSPNSITTGPDGNVWFTASGQVGQITPAGAITMSPVSAPVGSITTGPDGNLWMVDTQPDLSEAFPINLVARMPAAPLPANTSPPTISGVAQTGHVLTEAHGGWTNSPTTFTYQWNRCFPCSAIPGATSQTYAPTSADVGHELTVSETAITAGGGVGGPVSSAPTAEVTVRPAPVNNSPPSISGPAVEGQRLTAAHGSWSNGPITSYGQQWQRCDGGGNNCSPITDATSQSYVLTNADVGSTIRVSVTAANSTGTGTPASSAATGIVQASLGTPGKPAVGHAKAVNRFAEIPIRCAGDAGATCTVTADLTAIETVKGRKVTAVSASKAKRRTVSLGHATVKLAAGHNATLKIALSRGGTRLLAKFHTLRAEVRVLAGSKTISHQAITFRGKRKRS